MHKFNNCYRNTKSSLSNTNHIRKLIFKVRTDQCNPTYTFKYMSRYSRGTLLLKVVIPGEFGLQALSNVTIPVTARAEVLRVFGHILVGCRLSLRLLLLSAVNGWPPKTAGSCLPVRTIQSLTTLLIQRNRL